jgi:hypothetical protein
VETRRRKKIHVGNSMRTISAAQETEKKKEEKVTMDQRVRKLILTQMQR